MAGPGCWSRDQLLSLNLDAFLSLYKENEFPLELGRHLSLDQVNHQGLTQSLIKSDTASGLIFYGDDSVSLFSCQNCHVCSARPSYPMAPAAGGRCRASSCVWSSE